MLDNYLIKGEVFEDVRGTLRAFNSFNLTEIVRIYEIAPKNESTIRAWQGHKYEKKWFRCLSGSFVVNMIEIDNFDQPSSQLVPTRFVLNGKTPEILAVPNGFATGIKAIFAESRLEVFSNFDLEKSEKDDYRFSLEKWQAEW
ncbi:hypothetical protein [Flagellimonas sp.]|uniref:hypothetical protein n=1 Tax=Flagellimonas sp. TaxID=2058762 RepID=UPI003B5053E4